VEDYGCFNRIFEQRFELIETLSKKLGVMTHGVRNFQMGIFILYCVEGVGVGSDNFVELIFFERLSVLLGEHLV